MDFVESRVVIGDLASAFSKRVGDAEIQAWHRFCLAKLDSKRAQAAVRRIIEAEERFPSIAKFTEVAKSIRLGNEIGGAEVMVEIEAGVWRPLREEMAEMRELAGLHLPKMTEAGREHNRRRLAEVMAEHFGRPFPGRSSAAVRKAAGAEHMAVNEHMDAWADEEDPF